jgi:hypothetical protein
MELRAAGSHTKHKTQSTKHKAQNMMTWQTHLQNAISNTETREWSPNRGSRLQKKAKARHDRNKLRAFLERLGQASRDEGSRVGLRISTERTTDFKVVDVSTGESLCQSIECALFQLVPVRTHVPSCPAVDVWLDEEGLLKGGNLNSTATDIFEHANVGELHGNVVVTLPGAVP